MIDLNNYLHTMEHDPCEKNNIERSNHQAYQLDGENGLAKNLGFHSSGFSKTDYVKTQGNKIYFIEFTNLRDDIKECISCDYDLKKSSTVRKYIKEENKHGLKLVQKKLWMEILLEFKGKWMGSIALYERFLRLNNDYSCNPEYNLMIILKNDTDPKDKDLLENVLRQKLSGMISNVEIFLTNEL